MECTHEWPKYNVSNRACQANYRRNTLDWRGFSAPEPLLQPPDFVAQPSRLFVLLVRHRILQLRLQTDDLARAINELKAGRVEFRNDKTGNLHVPVGKASFDESMLLENVQAVLAAVNGQKPSAIKGVYLRRVVMTSTMGPGVRLNMSSSN